jgi:type IV pilus assembly protein PilV
MKRSKRQMGGFTLMESMIALMIACISVLGILKISALSLASTKVSSTRSIVALQAGSLASAMQANKADWKAGVAPTTFSASGTVITDASGILDQTAPDCDDAGAACTPAQLAADDLRTWAATMNGLVPRYSATFSCSNTAGFQITCAITVNWQEKYVAANKTTATGASQQVANQSYTLYVAP